MKNLRITYLGLATTLIELGGQSFLINPNFSQRVFLTKRSELPPPPASVSSPKVILITDARYAHLDLFSFKYFSTQIPIVAPKGLGKFLERFLPNPIVEIPLWSYHREGDVEIHAMPVQFRGYRWFPVRTRATAGYVLKSPAATVFYAAGTGYSQHFQKVASLFDIDLAILPLGPHQPNWLEKTQVLTPGQAFQAFGELRAKHWFPLGWKNGTREELERMARDKSLSDRVHFLKSGEVLSPQYIGRRR